MCTKGHRYPGLSRNGPPVRNWTPVHNNPWEPFRCRYMTPNPPPCSYGELAHANPIGPTPARATITPTTRVGAIVSLGTGRRYYPWPPLFTLTVDSSRTTIAWSWSHPASMRMSNPSCYGHKFIGAPLGPIGLERRRAPPLRSGSPRPEVRWPDSRLFGPLDSPCVLLDHTNLLVDILDSSIYRPRWDPDLLQASVRPGKRMPGPLPRPERVPS